MRGVRARRLLEVRTGNAGTKKHYVSKPWRRGEEEGKSALSRTFTLKCPSLTLSKNRGSHDDAFLLESGCVAGARRGGGGCTGEQERCTWQYRRFAQRHLIMPFSARRSLGASVVRVTRPALAQKGRSREVRLRTA